MVSFPTLDGLRHGYCPQHHAPWCNKPRFARYRNSQQILLPQSLHLEPNPPCWHTGPRGPPRSGLSNKNPLHAAIAAIPQKPRPRDSLVAAYKGTLPRSSQEGLTHGGAEQGFLAPSRRREAWRRPPLSWTAPGPDSSPLYRSKSPHPRAKPLSASAP